MAHSDHLWHQYRRETTSGVLRPLWASPEEGWRGFLEKVPCLLWSFHRKLYSREYALQLFLFRTQEREANYPSTYIIFAYKVLSSPICHWTFISTPWKCQTGIFPSPKRQSDIIGRKAETEPRVLPMSTACSFGRVSQRTYVCLHACRPLQSPPICHITETSTTAETLWAELKQSYLLHICFI